MSFSYVISDGIKTVPNIAGIGYTEDKSSSRFGPGVQIGYTIHFNIQGKGYFNGHLVEEGEGFFVYNGQHTYHYPDERDPWKLLWITLTDESAISIMQMYNSDSETNIFRCRDITAAREVAGEIKGMEFVAIDSLRLLELFLRLHVSCTGGQPLIKNKPSSSLYLDYAVKYLEDNIHLPVSVEHLTSAIGVSQPYLYRIFMSEFGVSPKQYIMNKKLELSKKMLRTSEISISVIASSVGYEDSLAFSRMFARKMGMSPTAYRKASMKKQQDF